MTEIEVLKAEHHTHTITYFVDNEPQKTTDPNLTVGQILKNAGLDPSSHYLIELRGHQQIEYKDINETIRVHENEKFISIFHGPTPLS
jgi:hypothetical protein